MIFETKGVSTVLTSKYTNLEKIFLWSNYEIFRTYKERNYMGVKTVAYYSCILWAIRYIHAINHGICNIPGVYTV